MSKIARERSDPLVYAIEDNPADIRLVEEGIHAARIDLALETIHSGQKAIERLSEIDHDEEHRHPDLILLDLNLPGRSGFDVLETVRNESAFQEVPIVVVSSSENPEDIRRVYESLANAYVTKPADPDEYIQMIDAAIDFWVSNVTSSPGRG